jgi:short-subunit dehydrogenase
MSTQFEGREIYIVMQINLNNKKIIVTGASSGIGERLVWHIAKNGGLPILLSRSLDKMKDQQKLLQRELQTTSFVYQVDLFDETELTAVMSAIIGEHEHIHGLINNAGSGVFEYVKDIAWQDIDHMFRLNVLALIQATRLILPHFLKQGEGHIINIASQAGKMATPKSAVYGATKHAVLGFTNALRLEVQTSKLFVTAVNLGPVRTNFFLQADPTGVYQKNVDRYMLDPDIVAKKIVRKLFTKKREINLPIWMETGSKLYQLFPNSIERLLKRQFHKK